MKLTETLGFTVDAQSEDASAHGLEVDGVSVSPNITYVSGGGSNVLVSVDDTNVTVTNNNEDTSIEASVTVTHWFSATENNLLHAHCKQYCISQGESEASAESIATDNLADLRTEAVNKWDDLIASQTVGKEDQSAWTSVKTHLESWISANLLS